MIQRLEMPKIGEDISEAKIAKIHVKPGDRLEEGQIFVEISTDKVDIDLPSPLTGFVTEIPIKEAQTVCSGGTLMLLETIEYPTQAARKLQISDILTAIQYLGTRNSHYLCLRPGLGSLKFDEFKGFIDDVAAVAQGFERLAINKLDLDVQRELRDTLFYVSDLIKKLQGFNPEKLGVAKIVEHKKICKALREDQQEALQRFWDILVCAGWGSEIIEPPPSLKAPVAFDPAKAYVFISYAHSDGNFAQNLGNLLARAHIAHFIDVQSIKFGEGIPERVHEELLRASHMIVLLSPASTRSAWVPYEMGYAKALNISVIPYLLHPSMEVPAFVANYHHMKHGDDEARLVRELSSFRRQAGIRDSGGRSKEWKSETAKRRLQTAHEICHQGTSSFISIKDAEAELKTFVERGGLLRCILADPEGEAVRKIMPRYVGAMSSLSYIRSQFDYAVAELAEISRFCAGQGEVILRTIDFVPEPVMTMVDPSGENGLAFVTLNGFGQSLAARPNFLLQKRRDSSWFSFYQASFETLWQLGRGVNLKNG